MQDRVGEEFAALVLNPTKYGLFVELTDLFVEGLVPIDTLRGDRYTWRENTHEILGERTGQRFRAGDRVQVILDRILVQERRLQFSIVEEGISLTGKTAPKARPKAKKKKATSAPGRSFKARKKLGKKGRRRETVKSSHWRTFVFIGVSGGPLYGWPAGRPVCRSWAA
jgi:ribonuclease R